VVSDLVFRPTITIMVVVPDHGEQAHTLETQGSEKPKVVINRIPLLHNGRNQTAATVDSFILLPFDSLIHKLHHYSVFARTRMFIWILKQSQKIIVIGSKT